MALDPITFEVLKHRVWLINDEAGLAVRSASPSPIVVEANDFNVAIFTADGLLMAVGPYVLTHATTMQGVIENVMRLSPTVGDGDAYLVNDPYLGALHQNDVAVVAPIYARGRRIAWVGNALHHVDVGGMDEGSVCVNARNIFQESPRYFLKIVEGGRFSHEVEHTFLMNSRQPDLVALDLRAQLGAINIVRERLLEVVDEFGVEAVEETLQRSIDESERQVRAALSDLPDGTWEAEVYMDGERTFSDKVFRIHVELSKKGTDLYFDYTGTDPQQEGPTHTTYYGCLSGSLAPVFNFLCGGEIDWNAGVKRAVHVSAPEGCLVNCKMPAGTSSSSMATWLVKAAAQKVFAEMLASSNKYRDRVCPSWGASPSAPRFFGVKNGEYTGGQIGDHRMQAAAGRSFADGFDHVGTAQSYFSQIANVEDLESKFPLLYLFRRQLADSGGPGRFRGGLTGMAAFVSHKTPRLTFKTHGHGANQSNASGIAGGYPGAGSQCIVTREVDVDALLQASTLPLRFDEFGSSVELMPSKHEGVLGPHDAFSYFGSGGGGYGDPFEREPERVLDDVRSGAVSVEGAALHYGVCIGDEMALDLAATDQLRTESRARRARPDLYSPTVPQPNGRSAWSQRWGEYLVARAPSEAVACARCGYDYGVPIDRVFERASVRKTPLWQAGPWLAMRWHGESPDFRLIEASCPRCGVLFDVKERLVSSPEAAAATEPRIPDSQPPTPAPTLLTRRTS